MNHQFVFNLTLYLSLYIFFYQFAIIRPHINPMVYTPLNKSVGAMFEILKDEPFFVLPASHSGMQLREVQGRDLCRYHNRYGHHTGNCRHLKDIIETLAQEGRIPGFVQRGGKNQAKTSIILESRRNSIGYVQS